MDGYGQIAVCFLPTTDKNGQNPAPFLSKINRILSVSFQDSVYSLIAFCPTWNRKNSARFLSMSVHPAKEFRHVLNNKPENPKRMLVRMQHVFVGGNYYRRGKAGASWVSHPILHTLLFYRTQNNSPSSQRFASTASHSSIDWARSKTYWFVKRTLFPMRRRYTSSYSIPTFYHKMSGSAFCSVFRQFSFGSTVLSVCGPVLGLNYLIYVVSTVANEAFMYHL